MKSAAISALELAPELLQAQRQHPLAQAEYEFIERALTASQAARESGEYYSAESVLQELDAMLEAAEEAL